MIALYVCRKAIGRSWGVSPANVNWIFEAVVKPTLMYGAAVWWQALERSTNRSTIERVMRSSALLITGALRTTPSKALFSLLNWLPADLLAKKIACCTALRLRVTGEWRTRSIGHSNILGLINHLPDNIDYCVPKPFFDIGFKHSTTATHSSNYSPEWNHLHIYTDGSKKGNNVGGGVYIVGHDIKMRFKLPNECSVLQAEISAIKRAANWLRYHKVYNSNICIFTDSQAAIKSLGGVYTTSKLVQECRTSLNVMARHSTVSLYWVNGHGDSTGNCIADALAKEGRNLHGNHIDSFCGIPLSSCKILIEKHMFNIAQTRWSNEPSCQVARSIWPRLDIKKATYLLSMPRLDLSNLVAAVTGHCKFGNHASRMGLIHNDHCRSCQDAEEEESIHHFFCHCPGLSEVRYIRLGRYVFDDLQDIAEIDLKSIASFVKASKWFE